MKKINFWDINNRQQVVKVEFIYHKKLKAWLTFIICGKNKRQCNDGLHKTKNSPKNLLGHKIGKHHTNNMDIFLNNIKSFDDLMPKYTLRVTPCNKYLVDKYKFLINYGFQFKYNDKNINGYYEKMKEV